jgi:hypothetical protein
MPESDFRNVNPRPRLGSSLKRSETNEKLKEEVKRKYENQKRIAEGPAGLWRSPSRKHVP